VTDFADEGHHWFRTSKPGWWIFAAAIRLLRIPAVIPRQAGPFRRQGRRRAVTARVIEAFKVGRRAIRRDHDLAAGVDQRIAGVTELGLVFLP
jgi:hypothetical protein